MPPRRLIDSPLRRCAALNKAGRPCGITSESKALDASGQLAAGPLLRGGLRCAFHARWFCTSPLEADHLQTPPLLVYLDLETTGLNLASDEIVEIGIWVDASRAAFSTVVRPSTLPQDVGVHGIPPEELAQGPSFREAFQRAVAFLEKTADAALSDDDGSSLEEAASELPRLRSRVPQVLLAAHNGLRFDFGMLVSQCLRCNISAGSLEKWIYVDTADVLKALDFNTGACLKLQCQRVSSGVCVEARAHRALDDCIALSAVMQRSAERLGQRTCDLLVRFALRFDLRATTAELASLV